MAYYFSGWGYREDVLPYFLSGVEPQFDVIAWSLGLVRFYNFLIENEDLHFDSALFIAPAYKFNENYVHRFVRAFSANPRSELKKFYRRAHWDPGSTTQDKAIDAFLLFDSDYDIALEELKRLLNQDVDVSFISNRITRSVCLLPRRDLIVPLDYQREFSQIVNAFSIEIDAPHFCLDRIPEVLKGQQF